LLKLSIQIELRAKGFIFWEIVRGGEKGVANFGEPGEKIRPPFFLQQ
jgi:hypothetical protein